MRRTLLQLLRGMSLLMCIAAIVMWIRSYQMADGFAWQRGDGSEREVVSYAGGVHIRQLNPQFALIPSQTMHRTIREEVPANASWQTRAGAVNEQVLWERGGFVVFAGHTQVLTLTGNSIYNWSGTINTGYASGAGTLISNGSTMTNTTIPTTMPASSGTAIIIEGINVPLGGLGSSIAFQGNSMQLLVVIPYWFIVLMFALLPGAMLLRMPAMIRANRRRRGGLCQKCGYDLRACGERCPECGERRE